MVVLVRLPGSRLLLPQPWYDPWSGYGAWIAGITDTVLGAVGDTTADTVEAGTTPHGCTVQGIMVGIVPLRLG